MVFWYEYNLDQWNDQEHLKNPWGGDGISSKLHFECLLCTKIVIFMLQTKTFWTSSLETVAFWQKFFIGFLNSLLLTTCVKVGGILRCSLHQHVCFLQKMTLISALWKPLMFFIWFVFNMHCFKNYLQHCCGDFRPNFKLFIPITTCIVFCLRNKRFVVTVQKFYPKGSYWWNLVKV